MYNTMLYYCLKCRKNTEGKNPKFAKRNRGKLMMNMCDSKKLRFIKEKETCGLLSNLR